MEWKVRSVSESDGSFTLHCTALHCTAREYGRDELSWVGLEWVGRAVHHLHVLLLARMGGMGEGPHGYLTKGEGGRREGGRETRKANRGEG